MLLLLLMTAWTQMFAQNYFMKVRARKSSELENGMQVAFKAIANDNSMWINWGAAGSTSSITKYTLETADENNKWYIKNTEGRYLKKSSSNNSIEWVETSSDATALRAFTPTLQPGNTDSPNEVNNSGKLTFPEWTNDKEGYQIRFTDDNNNFLNVQSGSNSSAFGTGNGSWSVVMVYDLAPYLLSAAPSNGQFSEKTYWHYLKINSQSQYSRYAAYTENSNHSDNQISLYSSNPISYGSFWAFVETNNGIQVYNAATGTSKVLTLSEDELIAENGNTVKKLKMIDIDTNTKNTWTDVESSRTNYRQFKITDGTSEYYINHTDANSTHEDRGKALYGQTDARGEWSDLMFEPVENIETIIEETRTNQQAITGAVGTLASESYDDFTAALNKGTIEGLVEALKIRDLTGTTVQFDVNNAYYLFAYASASATKYMQINNMAALNSGNKQTDNASIIWKFSGDESNGYKISGQGEYLDKVTTDSQNVPTVSNEDAAALYNLIKVPNKAAVFYIRPTDGKGLHIDSNGKVVGWNEGGGSEWYLIEAPSIDIEITSAGYATVNYPFAVQLPKGLTAYTGTANAEKSKFILEEVPGGAVPANTPVVIQGPKGIHTLAINYENAAEPISRDLSGSLLPIEILPDDYILAKNSENVVGFYKTTDGGTLAQNKAYIKSTPAIQAVRGFGFSTEGDGTTGIENTVTETENEEYYDLQGRRVMNPTKGIYVTKSGKKVLFVK